MLLKIANTMWYIDHGRFVIKINKILKVVQGS